MLDVRGFVAETNATHVFIVQNGRRCDFANHLLSEGITRATVLDLCRRHQIPHEVKDISLTEVYRADEMFCTGRWRIGWRCRSRRRKIGTDCPAA